MRFFCFFLAVIHLLQLSWKNTKMDSENVKIMSLFIFQMNRKYYIKEEENNLEDNQ